MRTVRTILLLALCLMNGQGPRPTVIGRATWEDCNGGVLPDQTEVPKPVPMP